MSAGGFVTSFYESDTTAVHPIRVQPETRALVIGALTNNTVSGPATSGISAKVSKGKRQYGLGARTVQLKFTSVLPDGYKADQVLSVPWLDGATFSGITKGAAGTYLGEGVEVVSKTPESIR